MSRSLLPLVLAAGLLGVTGCGSAGQTPVRQASDGAAASTSTEGTLIVLAAASLHTTFTELADSFESAHPGADVQLSFAGTSDLVAQLSAGSPGDVLASADEKNMAKAVDAGVVAPGIARVFATNTLTIVTPPGNPKEVATFDDLARTDVQVVVCAPQVPCGAATQKVAKAADVTVHAVSEENAVTDVLGKVTSGQADAGVVYTTDASGAGDKVVAVPFAEAADAVNAYPIATTKEAVNPALAQEFVDLITGPEGQRVLRDAGFGAPKE